MTAHQDVRDGARIRAEERVMGEADSALSLLNLVDELTKDVTSEQWAEIKAAAAKHEACSVGVPAERRGSD